MKKVIEVQLDGDIPREELVKGAKVLKQWADRIGVEEITRASIPTLTEIILFEIQFQEEFREKYGLDVFLHSYIHSRFEYASKIISYLLHVFPGYLAQSARKILLFLFQVYKVLLPLIGHDGLELEEDLYSISSTAGFKQLVTMNINEKGSKSWYKMCFTSASMLLHALIAKYPQKVFVLRLTMSEAMTLTKSSIWQVQLVALSVIRSLLHNDLYRLQKLERDKFIRATELELEALTGKSKRGISTKVTNNGKDITNTSSNQQTLTSKKLKSSTALNNNHNKIEQQSPLTAASQRLESKSAGNISRAASQVMRSESTIDAGGATRSIIVQQAEEICRIGFLRTITWCLFHRHYRIRLLAAQILQIQLALCRDPRVTDASQKSSPVMINSKSKPPESSSGMWSAMIEQGIIPLLETCASGFVVHLAPYDMKVDHEGTYTSPKFPEVPIRNVARLLLDDVMRHTEYFIDIRHRLLTALSYSGNQKLRINVLCSILCLCGQSPLLGSFLWEGTGMASHVDDTHGLHMGGIVSVTFPIGGQVFAALCRSLLSDTVGAKQVLDIIIQIFQIACVLHAHRKFHQQLKNRLPPNEIATQAGGSSLSRLQEEVLEIANRLRETLAPTILVMQQESTSDTNNISSKVSNINVSSKLNRTAATASEGRQVKMACPKLSVIRSFSTQLATEVEKFHFMQIDEAVSFYLQMRSEQGLTTSAHASIEEKAQIDRSLRSTIANFGIQYFLLLGTNGNGSYADWQELFSHMCPDNLRKKMLGKLSIEQLCSCLNLALQYEMDVLIQSYVETFHTRITSSTILLILRAAVLELRPPATLMNAANALYKKIHLELTLSCLEFLRRDWEFCVRRKDGNELKEILQTLCTIFGTLVLR